MAAPKNALRVELLDSAADEPQLQLSGQLDLPASEAWAADPRRAQQTWKALQAGPDEIAQERLDAERAERANLQLRKQVVSARAEAAAAQAQVVQLRKDRYPAAVVWGLSGCALLAAGGWLYERRRHLAARAEADEFISRPATPFPAAQAPRNSSAFDSSYSVIGDEAEQWIERAKGTGAKGQ
jgi:hypothetical protein